VGAGPRALAARFVELAADAGAAICFDVNYRALLWSPDDAREALLPMVRAAGLLVCARRDAELVFGLEGSDEDVLVALAELAQGGTTVLTLGREGCIARDPSGAVHSHPGFRATVVDRFGVGDAFVAGLLWGMLAGDLPLALARGAALAALKCGLHGDQAHVRREDAEALLSAGTREVIR
jgi:2-dehydro-3-deoxygluconokinase